MKTANEMVKCEECSHQGRPAGSSFVVTNKQSEAFLSRILRIRQRNTVAVVQLQGAIAYHVCGHLLEVLLTFNPVNCHIMLNWSPGRKSSVK